jgi:hypothetical protein
MIEESNHNPNPKRMTASRLTPFRLVPVNKSFPAPSSLFSQTSRPENICSTYERKYVLTYG